VKFWPLLLANLGRRKVRTALTVGSFAVAIFLFCLLLTIRASFQQGVEAAGVDRLLVVNKFSFIQPLPLAHRDRILQVAGVKEATFACWFGGVYQDPKNMFPQFAIDHQTYRQLFTEFLVPEAEWQAFLADKSGAIAGESIAKRFNWKLGDRIPIKDSPYGSHWEFNLRGIYTGARPHDDLTQFWFRWDYLDEKSPDYMKGRVGWLTARVEPGASLVDVAREIDARFANSAWETRTQSEQAWMASWLEQMGNIELLMLVVGSVVFFTLLLVTGNTMAMSVRERAAELAVLKTVGFRDRAVLVLVLAEAALIAAVGGGAGIFLAKLFTLGGDPTGGFLPSFYLPRSAVVAGAVIALAVGLMAGLIPALTAMRLEVVQAIRRL
jgi:putative ABC transport system permease protein